MRLILVLTAALILASCVKKRDETFVQGQGRDLLQISDYDGKEFSVETLELIADFKENPETTKSESVTTSKNSPLAKMGAVKVKTKADLLGDVPFIALPNHKLGYRIKYVITNEFLILMKVADKKLIHPKEIPGALEQPNKNEVGVPLVGYPIRGLINSENVDQNGAKSNKLTEITVNDKSEAKYFKIDKNNRIIYKLQDKMDLFTKAYFEGEDGKSEWYFAQTIIAAGDASSTGFVLAQQDNALNSLSKINFSFKRNEMSAVSVNLDPRLDSKDEINQTIMVKLPIEWKDYRAKPSGLKGFAMEEEENSSIDWEKRRYVKVDFAKASTISISNPNFRFIDLEVDTNYFSFTLFDPDNNLRIKQSFLRDQGRKKYVAKRLFKEDFEKFGFFDTQKNEINNYEKYRQQDFGKNIFINRYNVANGVIEFYFTEGSDEKLIPFAAKAADEWSEAFKKASVPLKIVAITDKDKRVRLGDLRYNQINLIRSANESNLFGYGPSITDPRTGEIIAATTNMHITSIVSALSAHIRDYMLFKSGQTKQLSVFVQPPALSEKIILKGDKVSLSNETSSGVATSKLLKKMPVVGLNGQLDFKTIELAQPEGKKDAQGHLLRPKNWGREFDIGVTGKNLNKEIEKMCPELSEPTKALEGNQVDKKENEMVIACAEKLLPIKMFGTLLHEMGHNFGLRHNFYGSVDAINFLSKKETETEEQVQSSSVMEYPSFGEDRLTKVGKYDVAALRYGYGDTVESDECKTSGDGDKECQTLKLDTSKTIAQNIESKNLKLRPYMFCTDDDVAIGTDPLCARHDAGTTPDAVAFNLINEYNASIADYNYRLGRQRKIDPMRLSNYRVQRFWIPLKKMYDEWRFRLNDYLGIGNEYLEAYDADKLDKLIKQKTAKCDVNGDPNSNDCQFMNYQKAADRIFNFGMQMATLPPKYCLGSRNGKMAAVEFADVRRIVTTVNKFVPKDCLDAEVKKYVEKQYGFIPVQESGYELEDVRLGMKVKMSGDYDWYGNPIPDPPDIIGLMPEKAIAMEVLSVRAALSLSSEEKPFRPNFLDEPIYREKVLGYVADRITKGINAKRLLTGPQLEAKEQFLEKYKYEKRFVDNMSYSVFYGLEVPEKATATLKRKMKFLVRYSDRKEDLEKAKYKVLGSNGTSYYFITRDEATEGKKLLQMLEILPKRLEAASPLTEKTFDAFIELIDSVLGKEEKIEPTKLAEFLHGVLFDEYNGSVCKLKPPARTKEELETDKYRVHWKKLLIKEMAVFRSKIQDAFDFTQIDGDFPICMGTMSAVYSAYGESSLRELKEKEPQYNLNKAILIQRIADYKKAAESQSKTGASDDIYNYEELTTQMEMITSVLRTMTEN